MNIWQVGSGARGREFFHRFIDYDVAFIGPGSEDYRTNKEPESVVKRFSEDVQPGDWIILRSGRSTIRAIGKAMEADPPQQAPENSLRKASPAYMYLEHFGDEDGWDLRHAIRVCWMKYKKILEKAPFGPRPRRFSKTKSDEIQRIVEGLDLSNFNRPLKPLPYDETLVATMEMAEVAAALFDRGFSQRSVEQTCHVIEQIQRLSRWYKNNSIRPRESETVAYMVLPLLLALGWSEQEAAIEWKKMDIAVFAGADRQDGNCRLVVEAKSLGSGLDRAKNQAQKYVEKKDLINCRWLLATDGCKYRLEYLENEETEEEPVALYINLEKIRSVELLVQLMPRQILKEA